MFNKITTHAAIVLALMGTIVQPAAAATGTLAPSPYLSVFDSNGNPVSGACIWTYMAGTTTPVATYTDKAIAVANTNPIVADASGQFVAYLVPGQSYKFTFETACTAPVHGSVLRTRDDIDAVPSSASSVDVTGTAGEALTAGTCAYLSDGSGAKTPGLWYKCDSTNTYSSTLPEMGIPPTSIALSQSGTIRLTGAATGLSSLTIGAEYYVGAAGALTSTAPNLTRHLGHADTATTLVLTANPSTPAGLDNGIDDFRLTLTSGTPVTNTDVTAAVTLFCTPFGGSRLVLFSAVGAPTLYTSAEFSIAVPATTSQMYDVFAFLSSGVPALELTAWTNDTTRATAIVLTTTGVYTKSGDLTRRYLGSFRTTTVSGQTEDSAVKRYLWNYYHRVDRPMFRQEGTASWTYTTDTWRQANAAAANQIDIVVGVAESTLHVEVNTHSANATATVLTPVSIGQDSTSTPMSAALFSAFAIGAAESVPLRAIVDVMPAVGRHFYAWLERSEATGTTTWAGSNSTYNQGGITARWGS